MSVLVSTFVDIAGVPKKITTDFGLTAGLAGKASDYLNTGLVTLSSPGGISGWLTFRYGFGEYDLVAARNKWSIAGHSQALQISMNR